MKDASERSATGEGVCPAHAGQCSHAPALSLMEQLRVRQGGVRQPAPHGSAPSPQATAPGWR
jgi:hypothetical protein